MMKISKKLMEGIRKKIALIGLSVLLLNAVMTGVFAPSESILRAEEEQMCEAVVDIVLIMDRSGSMVLDSPSRLSQAKDAANSFLGNLGVNDQSALVSYASTAFLDKGLSDNHTSDAASTEAAVNALVAVGGTNIGDAIDFANQELGSSRINPQAVKVAILLTDGRATCPVIYPGFPECGYIEDAGDIAYAEAKATEAALAEIKIFTIGLGSDVNETMLQNIAATTSAGYYFAPDGSALKGIYDEISQELCEYASISGCKYSDVDPNDSGITGDLKIEDWPIILGGDASGDQVTDENGCYSFTGLLSGTYTISEGSKAGEIFEQTFPFSPNFYTINLNKGDVVLGKDFGNYLPNCGNDIVDIGYGEVCEIGDTQECDLGSGYVGSQNCNQDCLGWGECIPQEDCGDGIQNGLEECDGEDGLIDHHFCTDSCTLEYIPYCGDGIVDEPEEECDGNDPEVCETVDGYVGLQACDSCFWGECIPQEFCGDGTINGLEICDDGISQNGTYGYCNLDCTGPTSSVCGDYAQEGDEECDDGPNGSDTCTDGCMLIVETGSLTICKQEDLNGNGILNEGEPAVTDPLWLFYIGEDEYQAEENGCVTIEDMAYGEYNVIEQKVIDWEQTGASGNGTLGTDGSITVVVGESNPVPIIYFLNKYEEPAYQCSDNVDNDGDGLIDEKDPGCWTDPEDSETYDPEDNDEYHAYCGDGTCNNNETCSTCSEDCGSCGGGSSVIAKPSIRITNEKVIYLGDGDALVTWTTNIETTRQVAYGDDSISTLGIAPEYGYNSVNTESTDMTKEHSVTISGLTDGIPYYFRPVADRSGSTGEVVGIEVFYRVGEVKGVTDPPIPVPIPIECNYLLEYIKLGSENNPVEVKKLETFLNIFEGENLAINGIYEQVDFDAVSRFQEKYLENVLSPWSHNKATGYVYITTKKKINELYCEREFPLTPDQEAEIARFSAILTEGAEESSESSVFDSESDSEEDMSESESKPGEVAGAKDETEDETEDEEEMPEEPEEPEDEEEKIEKPADDGVLLVDNGEEDEEQEDGSAVKAFGGLGSWLWVVVIILIGVIAYSFSSIAKRKKKE